MFATHSILIDGRTVSVRMEEEFWDRLRDIAADRNTTIPILIKEIASDLDGQLDGGTLASILRVYILEEVMEAAKSSDTSSEHSGRQVFRSIS
jgi:predicted DNA-binding ribbon-helix-helix protein